MQTIGILILVYVAYVMIGHFRVRISPKTNEAERFMKGDFTAPFKDNYRWNFQRDDNSVTLTDAELGSIIREAVEADRRARNK